MFGFSTKDDIPFFTKPTKTFDPFGDNNSANDTDDRKMSKLAGKMQHLVVGGEYVVKAKYKKDKKYGDQYTPIAIYAIIPQSRETQLLFLKSMIPEWMADNLINAYPNVVNDVANGTLKTIDYSLVKGVREITWNKIKEKIINNYLISDIISMLKPIGVTYAMIKKLLSEEPNPVLLKQELEKNPYIMTKIDGIGFRKCDDLALKLKPEATYEDNIWIKESSYEKLRDIFPTEISCGELDGKHSDVMGEVEIQNDWHTDEEYSKAGSAKHDGDYLELELKDLYRNNNLDWEEEQKEIKEYLDSLDLYEDVTVCIPASKKSELMRFVKTLKE